MIPDHDFTIAQMFQCCHLISFPKMQPPPAQLRALGNEVKPVFNAMKVSMLTLHCSYIRALNIILKFGNLLLEIIKRYEFVLFVLIIRSTTEACCKRVTDEPTTSVIWSLRIPYPIGTSLLAPHTRPSISMERTESSSAFISVSSSHGLTSRVTTDWEHA